MRTKSSKKQVNNILPIKKVQWPLGMVFDGGADDIELLRTTIPTAEFVQYLHYYLDLIKQLKAGKQQLFKVQIIEAQTKQIFVPAASNDNGEVLFHLNDLYKEEAPLNLPPIGFARSTRTIVKIN